MKKATLLLLLMFTISVSSFGDPVTPLDGLVDVTVEFTNVEALKTSITNLETNATNNGIINGTKEYNLKITLGANSEEFGSAALNAIRSGSYTVFAGVDLSGVTGFKVTNVTKFNGWDYFSQIVLPEGAFEKGEVPEEAFTGCTNLLSLKVGENDAFSSMTSVGNKAFNGCANLTTLDLSSCTTVGNDAFNGCSKVTSVTANNLTTIGTSAFYGCSSLTSLVFDNATTIGTNAFYNCSSLSSLSCASATSVGENAFNGTAITSLTLAVTSLNPNPLGGMSALREITLSELTVVPSNAFQGNTSIETVNLPKVTLVENNAFLNLTALSSVSLPEATEIKWDVFNGCTSLTSVSLPKVTTMSDNAFRGSSLATIEMEGLTSVPASGFANATELTTLKIPNVTSLGANAFDNTPKLTSVELDKVTDIAGGAFTNCSINTVTLPALTTVKKEAFSGLNLTGELSLPNVVSVEAEGFSGCAATKVTLENESLTTIPQQAFMNSSITEISIPHVTAIPEQAFANSTVAKLNIGKVTSIGANAFNGNSGLTSITEGFFATECTELPDGCFNGTNLQSIEVPASITTINRNFVDNSTKLTEIKVNASNTNYSTVGGMLCNKAGDTVIRCPEGNSAGTGYTIPDGIKTIGTYSFANVKMNKLTFGKDIDNVEELATKGSEIKEVVINSTVSNIDAGAFSESKLLEAFSGGKDGTTYYTNGDGLLYKKDNILSRVPEGMSNETFQAITLPNDLKEVGMSAFSNCSNLTEVSLPSSIEVIGTHAFEYCTALKSITLPDNLKEDGFRDAPFRGCSGLDEFITTENCVNFQAVDGILYDKNLTTLYVSPVGHADNPTIPRSVKTISAAAFDGAVNIKSVLIPQGVETIGTGVFQNSSIESVIIPHSVHNYGIDAFMGTKNMKELIILASTVLHEGDKERYNSFYGADVSNLTISISEEYANGGTSLVDQYKAAKEHDAEGTANDFGWGDIDGSKYKTIYHRAITEKPGEDGAEDTDALGYTNPHEVNQMSENDYDFVTLYRDFNKPEGETDENPTYYMLSLPFEMTKAQVADAFGPNTKIHQFLGRGASGNARVLNFKEVMAEAANDDVVIEKGTAVVFRPEYRYPSYMIDLRNTASTAEKVDGDVKASSVAAQKSTTAKFSDEDTETTALNYSFVATYQTDAVVPQYAYYVSGTGGVMRITKSGRTFGKAFRGYIKSNNSDTPLGAKYDVLSIDFNGVVTSINEVNIEGLDVEQPANIYNVNGQLVRSNAVSADGLQKGMYIMNGKKIVVK